MNVSAAEAMGWVQAALLASGLLLLWLFVLSPPARADRRPSALPAWEIAPTEFLVFCGCVLGGAFVLLVSAAAIGKAAGLEGDAATVLGGAAMQLGMLGGALLAPVSRGAHSNATGPVRVVLAGVVTFLASFPLIVLTALLAEKLAEAAGLPPQQQDSVRMIARMESKSLIAAMIVLAAGLAPLTEEVVFRGGAFRFLRTRIPRWAALLAPAVFFAALHVNWKTLAGLQSAAPLVVLAVLFSLAYERTGHIGVPIVAHALFNLNTIAGILTGFVKQS